MCTPCPPLEAEVITYAVCLHLLQVKVQSAEILRDPNMYWSLASGREHSSEKSDSTEAHARAAADRLAADPRISVIDAGRRKRKGKDGNEEPVIGLEEAPCREPREPRAVPSLRLPPFAFC